MPKILNKDLYKGVILGILLALLFAGYIHFKPQKYTDINLFDALISTKLSPKGDIKASEVEEARGLAEPGVRAIVLSAQNQKILFGKSSTDMLVNQIAVLIPQRISTATINSYKWLGDYELGVYITCGEISALRNWYHNFDNEKNIKHVKIKYFFPKDCPKETNTDFIQYGY